jgi:hypothetical protein
MSSLGRAERLRQILATRNLTLYGISQQSAQLYGRSSRFYVPHNLYNDVAESSFIPTIHQLLALSHITNYRLFDWLAVFDCDLDQVPRLQLLIRRARTTLLDSSVYDSYAWVSWFASTEDDLPLSTVGPLQRFLSIGPSKRATELLALSKRRFLYGKVGEQDLYARPSFVAASIVRIDPEGTETALLAAQTDSGSRFFFIKHAGGYTCSRLIVLGEGRIMLHSPHRPCGQPELRLGRDAQILGVIDAEIRPLGGQWRRRQTYGGIAVRGPRRRISSGSPGSLREYLRTGRIFAGLSFREASLASRWIAEMLSDPTYFAAPSTLSDYETLSEPPRHIQKICTLCVLYGIDFREFLRITNVPLGEEGRDPLPDGLLPRSLPGRTHDLSDKSHQNDDQNPEGMLARLLDQWEEVPLFLRGSLAELAGLKKFSLSDVFWVGGERTPMHPLLVNATLVSVNRRAKKPTSTGSEAFWTQPIYVILKRNGEYLCGHCTLNRNNLVVHSCAGGSFSAQRFRNGVDAEVVGQVGAILRRLL